MATFADLLTDEMQSKLNSTMENQRKVDHMNLAKLVKKDRFKLGEATDIKAAKFVAGDTASTKVIDPKFFPRSDGKIEVWAEAIDFGNFASIEEVDLGFLLQRGEELAWDFVNCTTFCAIENKDGTIKVLGAM